MTLQVLDPSSEIATALGNPAPRPVSLQGKTVGIISNGKEGTVGYFSHLGRMLRDDLGVAEVIMRVKTNYSAPADPPIVEEIRNWDAVISGIGD